MNKLISANYWFGCDWWFYEVGYLGMRAGQLSLACAGVYLWNTGYLRVTDPRMNSGFQQMTHKFGIKVPNTVEKALALHNENGNELWWKAIQKK